MLLKVKATEGIRVLPNWKQHNKRIGRSGGPHDWYADARDAISSSTDTSMLGREVIAIDVNAVLISISDRVRVWTLGPREMFR